MILLLGLGGSLQFGALTVELSNSITRMSAFEWVVKPVEATKVVAVPCFAQQQEAPQPCWYCDLRSHLPHAIE